uniref:Uncharacterized protein n=1 Tax=Picea sitchensis TaxID=3332 RepID=A0A6B9XQN4_PICSI|nr:hypothetical protein Q903MT_gene5444 [Picea sitchensis]
MVYHHLIRCSGGRELLHHGLAYEQRSEQQGLPTRVGVAEETGITIYDLFYYSSLACTRQQGLEQQGRTQPTTTTLAFVSCTFIGRVGNHHMGFCIFLERRVGFVFTS